MAFNPQEHLRKVQGGKDYLDVVWRVAWFRDLHPKNRVLTELLLTEPSIVFRAIIFHEDGTEWATGHGSAPTFGHGLSTWKGREIEKAETAAIGRALKNIGFATEYSYDTQEDSDGDYLADAPIEQNKTSQKQESIPNTPQKWETDLIYLVTPLFKARDHAKNAINGLLQNKVIVKGQALNEAAAAVFLNRALKEYEADEEMLYLLLGKHPVDFKQTPDAFKAAWEMVAKASKKTN